MEAHRRSARQSGIQLQLVGGVVAVVILGTVLSLNALKDSLTLQVLRGKGGFALSASLGADPLLISDAGMAPEPSPADRTVPAPKDVGPKHGGVKVGTAGSGEAAAGGPLACAAPKPGTPERLEAYMAASGALSEERIFFVTFTNYDRYDFARTWASRLCHVGRPHFAVGAMDDQTLVAARADKLPVFAMGTFGLGSKDYGWNTKQFKLMGQDKVQLLLDALKTNATVVVMDADAVVVADPVPFLAWQKSADLLVVTDFTALGAMDGGLEDVSVAQHVMNIGVMYAKPAALPFVERWRAAVRSKPDRWDQAVFNELLKERGRRHNIDKVEEERLRDQERLMVTRNDDFPPIRVGVLPIARFTSGHTWCVSKLPERFGQAALVFHTAFVFGGGRGKRHRMREHMVWYDEEPYFRPADGEVGFLVLGRDESPPPELLHPSGGGDGSGTGAMTVSWHFRLVNWQLARVRSGLLLARRLRRRFVMPRLICGFDRWWAPHQGIIPNSATLLPIRDCPMDHIFSVENIPNDWMPKEYSFLDNPRFGRRVGGARDPAAAHGTRAAPHRLPQDVRDSWLTLPSPNYASATAFLNELTTPEAEAAKVLEVAHIADVYDLFLKADDPEIAELAQSFAKRAAYWTGEWCCSFTPRGVPGNMAYDLFWDVAGHKDRHNRVWTEGSWRPLFANLNFGPEECTFSGPKNRSVECARPPR